MNDAPEELCNDEAATEPRGGARSGFLAGVIVGAIIGAGMALLFAPEAGTRTRRRLSRRARRLRAEAAERAGDIGSRTRRELRRRGRRFRRHRLRAER